MIDLTRVKNLISAAADAVEAGDYDLALQQATAAEVLYAGIPDGQKDQAAGGQFSFDRTTISRFLANVRRLKRDASFSASGGLQSVPINFGCEHGGHYDY